MELLPLKATFAPDEPVRIECRGASSPDRLSIWRLDERVADVAVDPGEAVVEVAPLPEGGYGVEAATSGAATAFDVLADSFRRVRYGFVADFSRGRDPASVVENARRLHLNAIQFYDWMYRHADLIPEADDFVDALGRRLSLATVRSLAAALGGAGAQPLGYAAVYAAGRDEWPRWRDRGLVKGDGSPWTLGDFLWIVDPTDDAWLAHLCGELAEAAATVGFRGFHLDQYGQPKRAVRADGRDVDLAEGFRTLIARVRAELPDARLVFNNVNGFPVWATARAPQDALYIEVWPPNETLGHLGRLVATARAADPAKPAVLAAYLSVYARSDSAAADAAARLVMATIFSHGGSHLLAGETGSVLTDPYYANNHVAGAETTQMLKRWYDFAVRYGDLLYDERMVDVTTAVTAGINEDIRVRAGAPVTVDPEPGAIWVHVVETSAGLVIHLIDLRAQTDIAWDAPKHPTHPVRDVRLELLRAAVEPPSVAVASPEAGPRLRRLETRVEGAYDAVELPPWETWALVLVRRGRDAAAR